MRKYSISNIVFYSLLKQFIDVFGRSPNITELMTYTDLNSSDAVFYHLRKLKEKGKISYKNKYNLNITINEESNL